MAPINKKKENSGPFFVLETNSDIFSKINMFPQNWETSEISLSESLDKFNFVYTCFR